MDGRIASCRSGDGVEGNVGSDGDFEVPGDSLQEIGEALKSAGLALEFELLVKEKWR
jgi:hypothetical protein